MMGLIRPLLRRFDVLLCDGETMEAPKGLILFEKSKAGSELKSAMMKQLVNILLISTTLVGLSFVIHSLLLIPAGILLMLAARHWGRAEKMMNVPLAINLNHPFMLDGYIGVGEVMVNFDGWKESGQDLFHLHFDNFQKTWIISRKDEENSFFAEWQTKTPAKILQYQIGIINQAIALCSASNQVEDDFEDARERESDESGLLDREWLPEEEIAVQGPLSRILNSD